MQKYRSSMGKHRAKNKRMSDTLDAERGGLLAPSAGDFSGRRRLAYLDGLRALAALFVLIHHAWATIFPPQLGVQPTGWLVITNWAKLGPYGVTVFIVLAGFSLTLAVAKRNGHLDGGWMRFIGRRAWRILPPYYAALILTILISLLWINEKTGTHWDLSVPLSPEGVVIDFALLQDTGLFKHPDVAYTFWSIAVEWHIYFTFPVLLVIWRRYGVLVASLAGFTFGVTVGFVGHFIPALQALHPQYYSLFAVAIGACALAQKPPSWLKGQLLIVVFGFTAIAAGLAGFNHLPWYLVPVVGPDILLGLAVASGLTVLGMGSLVSVKRMLSWRPLAMVGEFSYSIYLVHAPLLQVLWLVLVRPWDLQPGPALLVMWFVASPVIVLSAFLFYRVAEKPFAIRKPLGSQKLEPSGHP